MNNTSGNMEVINLEQKLTTEQQVTAFNENVLGYYEPNTNHEDFQYGFGISNQQLKMTEKEKGEWWGTIQNIVTPMMNECIDLGYIPWKLTYVGLVNDEDLFGKIEGGVHQFYLSCEDRRITRSTLGHTCDGKNNDCDMCYKRRNKRK